MAVKTYSPKDVIVTVGPFLMSGYADDTFVVAERNEDAMALQVGADGEATRTRSANRSGTVTLTLMHTSEANAVLNNYAQLDETLGAGTFPVMVKDLSGSILHAAETAWVKKRPASEFANEAGTREWVMETDNLVMSEGGY